MTAEIVILNKHGIALAADSAVTVSSRVGHSKTYNAANKLFSMGENQNIGFMIYGNSDYMGVPIEIIFKEFRKKYKNYKFESIVSCSEHFIEFIKEAKFNKSEIAHETIYFLMVDILESVLDYANISISNAQASNESHSIEDVEVIKIIQSTIYKMRLDLIDRNKQLLDISIDDFLIDFLDVGSKLLKNKFSIPTDDFEIDFLTLVYESILFSNIFDVTSGIVFGGYGSEDLFPSAIAYEVSYFYKDSLKIRLVNKANISPMDCDATIVPFAQSDMVATILKGMDPKIQGEIIDKISNNTSLTEDEKRNIIEDIEKVQQEEFIDPILKIVGTLSLPELANMAKTLVNLTSFKRHITDSLETVGGPIDVLVISKGDGPIWIDRKEYFDLSKNLDYQIRKGGSDNVY